MIWLTWRQQRTETRIAALLLMLVAAFIVPTGLQMASVHDGDGVAACVSDPSGCHAALVGVVSWFNFVPMLLGALLAAPLVLEFERGTFRLAWTQSVTRDRWLVTRIALVVTASLATALFFALLMTWWHGPLDDINGRFSSGFDLKGVVPLAYTLFAAALVISLGVVLGRTAAAIGLACIVFLAVRIVVEQWARPNYQEPIEASWTEGPGPDLHGALILAADGLGDPDRPEPRTAIYHPESRFWEFQAIEASIFVAMALVLLAFSIWWIRKRIS